MCQKWESDCGLWVLNEMILKKYAESLKKSWQPFRSCLLNSRANPAKLGWKWAGFGLAVLFSRQLLNGSHDLFQTFSIYFFNYFIKNPQTTMALPFLTHNISAIGGVYFLSNFFSCTASKNGVERVTRNNSYLYSLYWFVLQKTDLHFQG